MDTDDPKPFLVSYMEALASTEDLSELAGRWPPLVKIKHDLDARLPDGKALKVVTLSREQGVASRAHPPTGAERPLIGGIPPFCISLVVVDGGYNQHYTAFETRAAPSLARVPLLAFNRGKRVIKSGTKTLEPEPGLDGTPPAPVRS